MHTSRRVKMVYMLKATLLCLLLQFSQASPTPGSTAAGCTCAKYGVPQSRTMASPPVLGKILFRFWLAETEVTKACYTCKSPGPSDGHGLSEMSSSLTSAAGTIPGEVWDLGSDARSEACAAQKKFEKDGWSCKWLGRRTLRFEVWL